MFTPSTWYFLSREIVDIWKQLEEKTNEQQTHQLTKYANSPSNWYKKQLEGIPNFQKVIEKLGVEELKRINKASEKAIKKAIDLVDNETLKSFRVKETKQEIRQDKERFIASSVKKVINQNEGKMNAFIRNASVRNGEFINKINVKKESTAKIRTQFTVNTKTQELYDIIRKQTEEGIQKGVPFTYSNGRRVPFKAHMEMSIRTTIQNEALERMTTAASNLGIIFYLASEHADSADDHANFQGKIYVLENWESKITDSETREKVRNFIREKDIRTIEWVKGEPVWFNTRPNCRHYFIPITIEQAMGNLNNLKRNLRTKKGTYREENYQDLKLQRHNERQIRFYKERAKNNEILLARTKDPFMQSQLRNQITRDKRLTRDWQARQRGLLKSNPNLERNYRRESTEKMAQDLGVRLHLKGGKSLPNEAENVIVETQPIVEKLEKLKDSGMSKENYEDYLNTINNHRNPSITDVYLKFGDEVENVKSLKGGGGYSSATNTIEFSLRGDTEMEKGMHKYNTLAHEYAHFFDHKATFSDLNFKEIEKVRKATSLGGRFNKEIENIFKNVASSSDEFLKAIREDKKHIRKLLTPEVKETFLRDNASAGVQDAISGFFPRKRIRWGHSERYYNQTYATLDNFDKVFRKPVMKNALKQTYLEMGFDASNQGKVKNIVRDYSAASEVWANIMAAETLGGDELEYTKTYLPNSYKAMLEILKGVT